MHNNQAIELKKKTESQEKKKKKISYWFKLFVVLSSNTLRILRPQVRHVQKFLVPQLDV